MWRYVDRFISRKLLVFIVASVALFTSTLDSAHWTAIACIYLGMQGYLDVKEKRLFSDDSREDQRDTY